MSLLTICVMSGGGTALPICVHWLVCEPKNLNLFEKDCREAASRDVKYLFCVG